MKVEKNNKKCKVAILTGFNPYEFKGGLEIYILNLINILQKENIEIDIFFPEKLVEHKDMFYYTRSIADQIEKKYDILLANSPYAAFVHNLKVKKIVIFHGSFRSMANYTKNYVNFRDYLKWYYIDGIIEFLNLASADYRLFVSPFLLNAFKELYSDNYFKENTTVIESGIDTDFFKPLPNKKKLRIKYGIPDNRPVGLFVGRNDVTKGYDIFRKVFLHTKYIYWIQAISSGGVNQYELLPIKTFKEVDKKTMLELYNLADFSYLPSRFEGFGFAFIESLSCGTPAIFTNTGIAKEFSGIWKDVKVDITSIDIMIEKSIKAIKLLTEYPNIRKFFGKSGRKIVTKKYSINVWKEKIIQFLSKVFIYTSSSPKV